MYSLYCMSPPGVKVESVGDQRPRAPAVGSEEDAKDAGASEGRGHHPQHGAQGEGNNFNSSTKSRSGCCAGQLSLNHVFFSFFFLCFSRLAMALLTDTPPEQS